MSFVLFARAHGVEITDLVASDRIQRCATVEHQRSKNGAYFWDGRRGWCMAWDGDGRVNWYDDPDARPWTDEEKRAWALRRQTEAASRERQYENAAMRAAVMLRSTRPGHHGYLMRKGLPDVHGLCLPDGALFVPMRNLRTNELQGAQVIRWLQDEMRWEKKMLPGMRAKGAVLRLGKGFDSILCEGYATGLSIELAARQLRLSASVLVCFSDSNMVHIAPMVKGHAIVFADNDESQAGERAAKATGLPYCMAPTVGWDANDWHAKAGLMPVCAAILNAREATYVASG